MTVANKTQKAGGSCGTTNNKMKGGSVKKSQNGGGSCGAVNNKMKGGNKHENKMKMNGGSKKTKKSGSLAADEAICFACRRAGKKFRVKMVDPKEFSKKTTKRTMKFKSGKCPACGGKVFKIVGGAK
jgi:hypothetical protein